ncbi:probetacellulin isoform X3 [Ictalurus furcatus]|uniref:probetacellulin isoform X3 n=1 Tax=Ictalurus furcatus TaxID=66913 RepID=UPI00234FE3BB|nr:probetacellulin isoform X3 [Ictalurus furcatus]
MEKTYKLLLGIFTVALCKYSQAEWNTTRDAANKTVSCGPHDNSGNCTDTKDIHQWSDQFSECPDKYTHFCIHGTCHFVQLDNRPICNRRLYRKKRRKEKKRDEVERLTTLNTNEASLAIGDMSDTNTV